MAQLAVPDKLAMLSYLTQVHELFRREIPVVPCPKLPKRVSFISFFFFANEKAILMFLIHRRNCPSPRKTSWVQHRSNGQLPLVLSASTNELRLKAKLLPDCRRPISVKRWNVQKHPAIHLEAEWTATRLTCRCAKPASVAARTALCTTLQ